MRCLTYDFLISDFLTDEDTLRWQTGKISVS